MEADSSVATLPQNDKGEGVLLRLGDGTLFPTVILNEVKDQYPWHCAEEADSPVATLPQNDNSERGCHSVSMTSAAWATREAGKPESSCSCDLRRVVIRSGALLKWQERVTRPGTKRTVCPFGVAALSTPAYNKVRREKGRASPSYKAIAR
jgi:hypothetical protein